MRQLGNILLIMMGFASLSMFGATYETAYESTAYIFDQDQQQEKVKSKKTSSDPFINQLNTKTDRHNTHNPVEKVFLHYDKNMLATGDILWYSIYVVIGPSHLYTDKSKVIHVDLIGPDGKIAVSQTHALINGRGSGDIKIPKNLAEGSYQLQAYTQWMRNFDTAFFFTETLHILNTQNKQDVLELVEDKIDLQFFPEGGHLVADIASKVSFKAVGGDGLPKIVSGKILNSEGKEIAILKTFDRGSGFFQLTPKKGENYVAELDNGMQYMLPETLNNGYVVTVNNRNRKSIKVTVQASESLRDHTFYILGHMRQRNYFHRKFKFDRDQMFKFEISKDDMPSGVLTLTLFDSNKNPWSERPIFINNEEELFINTKIHSNKFVQRGKVTVVINVKDSKGKPIATNLSLAATDLNQIKKRKGSGTILSHLLLGSEIKGKVTNLGLLFRDQHIKTIQQLDLVMLTHAWRKYNWPEVWNDVKPIKEFEFAEGLKISGKAFNTKNKIMPNATLNVFAKSGEVLGMFVAKTNLDGKFTIPDFNFYGKTDVVFNAYNYKDKPLDVKVSLNQKKEKLPIVPLNSTVWKQANEIENFEKHSVARKRRRTRLETDGVTKLEEVVVTEKKKKKSRNQTPSALGMEPDAALYTEDHIAMQMVLDLIRLFAGVTVSGTRVSIRNGGTPLFVLDGIPLSNGATSAGFGSFGAPGAAPSLIANMTTFDVERVEILKGPRAAMWGSRGANGVILIYTKRGEGQRYNPIISPGFTISGHAVKKEFYSPKYDVKLDAHDTPDYRATLYWNPSVTTDKEGNASIEFFNSDTAKQIQLSIEGLSHNGIPGAYLETIGENE